MRLAFCLVLFLAIEGIIPIQAQTGSKSSATFLFIGDVMGHGMQIKSALDESTGTYSYDSVFSRVSPIFALADVVVANLEVTLAGPPYTGYPQFSSPDALVDALQNAGVDALVTANNHSVDRGAQGILRTIDVLEQKGIPFAGTYRDAAHKNSAYPLVLEQNGIRVALLNYTYGTNGIPVPAPTIVNPIDTAQIRADYLKAKGLGVDEVIVLIHWGNEYERSPNLTQLKLTAFMYELGIRIIIGSHPHVLQRMECSFDTDSTEGRMVVYSLGNFVSNQRTRYCNGGGMAAMRLEKDSSGVRLTHAGHFLVWVHTPKRDGKQIFQILPVAQYEQLDNYFSPVELQDFSQFVSDSRAMLGRENFNVPEITYTKGQWVLPWIEIATLAPIPLLVPNIYWGMREEPLPKIIMK